MVQYENTFVREVKEKNITDPAEILNWYRNLYYKEGNHTEHGIVACAINDLFAHPKKVVVLPCEVGQMVYVIEPLWYSVWGEDEHKCRKCEHFYEGGMGDHPDCGLGENCCYQISEVEADVRSLVDWITPNRFTGKIAWGKTVFPVIKDAEKALAEKKSSNAVEL